MNVILCITVVVGAIYIFTHYNLRAETEVVSGDLCDVISIQVLKLKKNKLQT